MPLLLLGRFGNLFWDVILLLALTFTNMQLILFIYISGTKGEKPFFQAFISTIYLNLTRVLSGKEGRL